MRLLRKNPGFALVAIITLVLGIGANTAIFSIVKGVVLRSLPFDEPSSLYHLWTHLGGFGTESVSVPDFIDWRDQNPVFPQLVAYYNTSANASGASEPE